MTQSDTDLTVYYNGACNICGPEVALYRKLAADHDAAINFIDISASCPVTMDKTTLLKQFHVRDGDERMHKGLDAFILLWKRLPKFRHLATLTSIPGIRHLGQFVYLNIIAPWLYRRYLKQIKKDEL